MHGAYDLSSTNTNKAAMYVIYFALFISLALMPLSYWKDYLYPPMKNHLTVSNLEVQKWNSTNYLSWTHENGGAKCGVLESYVYDSLYVVENDPTGRFIYKAEVPCQSEEFGTSFGRSKAGQVWQLQLDMNDKLWALSIDGEVIVSYEDKMMGLREKAQAYSIVHGFAFFLMIVIPLLLRFASGRILPSAKMSLFRLFFVFDNSGIPRRVYWVYGLIPFVVLTPFFFILSLVIHVDMYGAHFDKSSDLVKVFALFFSFYTPTLTMLRLLMSWSALSLAVKRLHDRGRTGKFLFVMLIPILGPIWLLWELLFRKGEAR